MGNLCGSCFKSETDSTHEVITPDIESRRRMQEEAAERRRQENESRGIKNPEKFRRQQQKAEELDKHAASYGTPNLRWQAN